MMSIVTFLDLLQIVMLSAAELHGCASRTNFEVPK